jgi:uncharacterized membrane protein YeiB
MWLGRCDVRNPAVRRRMLAWGVGVYLISAAVSRLVLAAALARHLDAETAEFLFGTGSMPPLPLFLGSAAGFSVAVIALCLMIAARFPENFGVRALVAVGQLSLTWYLAHIVIGLGLVVHLRLAGGQPLARALTWGSGFFAAATIISVLWKRYFQNGPLEWVMRRLCD